MVSPPAAACLPTLIGVIGAGTMGAGITEVSGLAGVSTILYDPVPGAVDRGLATIDASLERARSRGRIAPERAADARAAIRATASLEDLAACDLVIEAVPEDLDVKIAVLTEIAAVTAATCVLATNTSSLSVTEIAAAVPGPERVVGMHFFNPVPAMRLMEVIAGEQTSLGAVAFARSTGEAMGKSVISAADVAGFLVNRVNRPYSLEALRLLEQRLADVATIDRVARLAGGFRMGPFELMDLIGIDTNHAVAVSFQRRSYGEPRYRPSPLAARKIAAGHLGRKTGRGWYGADPVPENPIPPAADVVLPAAPVLAVAGDLLAAAAFRVAAVDAGWTVAETGSYGSDVYLAMDFGDGGSDLPADVPVARSVHRGSLHALDPLAVGFHVVPPIGRLVEITTTARTPPDTVARLDTVISSLGLEMLPVGDAPGLLLGRIVCQLINEAAFAIGEGNGTAEDVDAGLRDGVNHPRGPVEWSTELGLDHVLAVLDALYRETGEERYRAAPLLRRQQAVGAALGDT